MGLCLNWIIASAHDVAQFFPDLLGGENYPQLAAVLCLAIVVNDYPYLTLIIYGTIGYYFALSTITNYLVYAITAIACLNITIRFLTTRSPAKFEVSVPTKLSASPPSTGEAQSQKMPLTIESRPDKIQCWSPVDGKYLGEVSVMPGCIGMQQRTTASIQENIRHAKYHHHYHHPGRHHEHRRG